MADVVTRAAARGDSGGSVPRMLAQLSMVPEPITFAAWAERVVAARAEVDTRTAATGDCGGSVPTR